MNLCILLYRQALHSYINDFLNHMSHIAVKNILIYI